MGRSAAFVSVALSAILALRLPDVADAHGHMTSPRSRNWVAAEDGTDGWGEGTAGVPPRESCPHCLNNNEGVCGKVSNGGRSYDPFLDSTGAVMPWTSQATYVEGGIINVKSYLDTHHNGHMTLSACPLGPSSTQECFDDPVHKLHFVEDVAFDMPADPNYPERGYYYGGQGGGVKSFEMRFKLPEGIHGDRVMLQWRYITANSCSPPGYAEYFSSNSLPNSFWTSGLSQCTPPYPNDGTRSTTWPEQFFNCAEVTVTASTPSPLTPAPPPTNAPPPTEAIAAPTPATNPACCTQNFRDCVSWCGATESECINCDNPDVFWAEVQQGTCIARSGACTGNNDGCCAGLTCVGDQYYAQCVYQPPAPSAPTPAAAAPTPDASVPTPAESTPTTPPAAALTTPVPPVPSPVAGPLLTYSCSASSGGKTTMEALRALESITHQVSSSPLVLSAVASGGAAGDGSYVVSESQSYGVLTAGLALASLDESDPDYAEALGKFEGYFNGWREMCRSSAPPPCQNPVYCDGGTVPCLPGWKHSADFTSVVGTGSAPDGDEDAIAGMIVALKAVENNVNRPVWYDEVFDWADRSCTQFLQDNTVLSSSGSHRLLKLGSCWGGWDANGNNPSYHAPGHYRMMRDFQASVASRSYAPPSYVNADGWNMLIDTSYKALATTQCPDTGLVPNWALVTEVDSSTLAKHPGSFSGSGTPQYEFGAEASRTVWRVAFDAAAYPEEAAQRAGSFLAPLQRKLVDHFDPSPINGWEYFGSASLEACGGDLVSNVFGSWQWNYFISAPVFSSVVAGGILPPDTFDGKAYTQQDMVDAACQRVSIMENLDYYPLSWQVIAQMTLNGEVAKVGSILAGGTAAPTESPSPTSGPASAPTEAPIVVNATTTTTTTTTAITTTTTQPSNGCLSNNYKDCNADGQDVSCTAVFLPDSGADQNCIALWGECTGQTDEACCGPAVCHGDGSYGQCVEPADSQARRRDTAAAADKDGGGDYAPAGLNASSAPTCVECDDIPARNMLDRGVNCGSIGVRRDALGGMCAGDGNWIRNRFCRLSCFRAGFGYEGDLCCEEGDGTSRATSRLLRTES